MATLAEAVDAAETDWLVSADIPDTVDYLTVESETVQVSATFPAQYQARDGSTSAPRIRVVRAAGGTTAASHADGTTLTPLIPPSAGGGAAEAGTVVENLTGAETAYGHFYRGDEDPEVDFGAELEPGDKWTDTSTIANTGTFPVIYARKERNAANDGWQVESLVAVDGSGNLVALLYVAPEGTITANILDTAGVVRASLVMDPGTDSPSIAAMANDATGTPLSGLILDGLAGVVTILGTKFTLSGLPTVNPADGSLWSDAGVVKVSS